MITTELAKSEGLQQFNVKLKVDKLVWGTKKLYVPVWAPADCTDIEGLVAAAAQAANEPVSAAREVTRGLYTVIAKF